MKQCLGFPFTWSAENLCWQKRGWRTLTLLLAAFCLAQPTPGRAQSLDLSSLTCEQVALISPEAVQTTVMGLVVGYAMGDEGAAFDLEEANAWFAALRDLCGQAPRARVTEVMPLLADHVAARNYD